MMMMVTTTMTKRMMKMTTMRNPMQSKYIAIVGGDPMLLYMVAPVVNQSGNLIMILSLWKWLHKVVREHTF